MILIPTYLVDFRFKNPSNMSDTMGVYENNALKFSQACLAILGSSPFVYPFSLSLAREAENQTSVIAKKEMKK